MARFKCPQCGRRFGSVGEMLNHTEQVHAGAEVQTAHGSGPSARTRGMPSAEPGPVATERASQAEFEPQGAGDVGTFDPGPAETTGEGEEKKSPALGTMIALVVIAIIIILNIIGGGSE